VSRILFLTDGGEDVGSGHLSRCAALAAALRDASVTSRLLQPERAALAGAPWEESFDSVEAIPSLSLTPDFTGKAVMAGVDAVVVDGVALLGELGGAEMSGASYRVVIDDGPARPLAADLIVNPNLSATRSGYETFDGGDVLAGPRWALLGPAYGPSRDTGPVAPAARRILVTCGAADPAGLTERFVEGVARIRTPLETVVVIGPFNPRRDALSARCAELGLETALAPPNLRGLAEGADLALTALGTTATELAFLGVPNVAAAVAARQVSHLHAYEDLGFLSALGWHAELTPDRVAKAIDELAADATRRQAMRSAGIALVDGLGASRVAGAIVSALRQRGRLS
jgi:spore coat polysaccharide biosynthesis predicted glycosyltransferase SpsG